MARICVFDVNETLLDLGALEVHFERAFGDPGVRRIWFSLGYRSIRATFPTLSRNRIGDASCISSHPVDLLR